MTLASCGSKSFRSLVRAVSLVLVSGCLSLLGLPNAVSAQQSATIRGTVANQQGAPIGFANVMLVEIERGTLTDANGRYTLRNVPPGTYTLRADLLGYKARSVTVDLAPGAEVTQDFTLAQDFLNLEGIVVTGTRTPTRKLESSVAISTMRPVEIEQKQPRSTADLLSAVPGYYVESSGGEVGNNLFVRGLPADGSFRYVMPMEDGMPAFEVPDLFFVNGDNFIRFDENIDRLEAVRGGSAALYGSNATAGLFNLISKTGGPEVAGVLKGTVGTRGFNRYDLNVNGPISEDWRFSVGGYYRFDDGIRDPGFPAGQGGQIKANITRLFDQGFVRIYGKYINDRNVFFLPLPLVPGERSGDVVELQDEFIGGFPDDGTLTTRDAAFLRVPLPRNNGELQMPLEDGITQTGSSVMAQFALDFSNDWSVENSLRFMNLDHQWNAVVPFAVLTSDEFIGDLAAGSTAELTFAGTGEPFDNRNDLVLSAGLWHVEKPMTSVANQLQVRKTFRAGERSHDITVGSYFAHYTENNLWFFNDITTEIADRPRLLDLTVTDADGELTLGTQNGFSKYLSFFVNGFGNTTLFSFFGGAEIEATDRLTLDLGARFERDEYEQDVENIDSFDLGDPTTTADDGETWGVGSFTRRNAEFNEWAASVGANLLVNDQVSVYVRGSRAYKMPLIDQYLFSDFPETAEELFQAEGGVKVSTPWLGLSAAGYWQQLSDFPSQDVRVDPVTGETSFESALVGEARTIGFELESIVSPAPGLELNGNLTLQDPQYTEFIEGGQDLDGNWIRRIPQVFFTAGGTYTNAGVSITGDWHFFGKRFANNANTIELPEFGYVNGRIAYQIPGSGTTVAFGVQNIADGSGLTEGNPRLDEAGAPAGPTLARPILPRRFTFSVRYPF